MPTTSNFGWTTPADTDLVKDGAAAIRTLGNGIDTSLVDLKGGTTGQILSKASNTDLDYTWINNDQGDITEVVAGTGISGGGTSGSVTITNTVATAFDAKGDLIGGTGADTFSRLAVGTNDQVLTADSSTATGLKWATPSSGSMTLLNAGGTTLSGASVTVSSIPNTYFRIYVVVRDFYHSGNLNMTLNSSSSGYSYNYQSVQVSGSVVTSYQRATTSWQLADSVNNSNEANTVVAIIDDYTATAGSKPISSYGIYRNATQTNVGSAQTFGGWENNSAVTSVTVQPSSGNFGGGTLFVYGVK